MKREWVYQETTTVLNLKLLILNRKYNELKVKVHQYLKYRMKTIKSSNLMHQEIELKLNQLRH